MPPARPEGDAFGEELANDAKPAGAQAARMANSRFAGGGTRRRLATFAQAIEEYETDGSEQTRVTAGSGYDRFAERLDAEGLLRAEVIGYRRRYGSAAILSWRCLGESDAGLRRPATRK